MQNLIVTDAGLAALINAKHSGTTPITITQLKLGDSQWTADGSATALKNVTKTFEVQYGGTADPHTIQVAVIDQSEEQYKAYEMGIFTDQGILFAIATSSSEPIVEKFGSSIIEIICNVVVKSAEEGDIQIGSGDLTFLTPVATEKTSGIAQFATEEEVLAGEEDGKMVSPATLHQLIASEEQGGLIEIASAEETQAGKDNTKAITPKTFADTLKSLGYRKMPAGTLISVLTKATVPPEGFLFLDGSKIPKADYPTLVALGIFSEEGENLVLPNWDGRVGQTTNTPELVGTTIEDSVPNITGKFGVFVGVQDTLGDTFHYNWSSPWTSKLEVEDVPNFNEVDHWTYREVGFDASYANSKYGKEGTKIQPAAFLHRTLIAY